MGPKGEEFLVSLYTVLFFRESVGDDGSRSERRLLSISQIWSGLIEDGMWLIKKCANRANKRTVPVYVLL